MENYVTKLEPCTVIIQRRNILSSVFRAVQQTDFDFHRPLTVIFSGEDATDEGGPSREFFRLKFLLQLYVPLYHTIFLFAYCAKRLLTHWEKSLFGNYSYNITYKYKCKVIVTILDICVKQ